MEHKNIAAAFVKAQAEIESAVKDKKNPAFRSTYADLLAVIEAIKPALANHGLGFIQEVTERDTGGVYVETVIIHESGEMLRTGKVPVPASKNDAHGYGSAITYGKRYSLMAALGVPAEDDDGNAASKPVQARQNGAQQPDAESDKHRAIREVADACIATHAAAVSQMERENDTSGFWELHRAASRVIGEDRMILWEMLNKHSAVRAAIKEYAGYAQQSEKTKAAA